MAAVFAPGGNKAVLEGACARARLSLTPWERAVLDGVASAQAPEACMVLAGLITAAYASRRESRPAARCRVRGCGHRAGPGTPLCRRCWALVPQRERQALEAARDAAAAAVTLPAEAGGDR